MDYVITKSSHQALVALSLMLFWLRVACKLWRPVWLQVKWLKVLPHCNDTLLMAMGLWLCYLLSVWPWQLDWLLVKLLALLAYIGAGGYCLKYCRTRLACVSAALLASAIYAYMIGVALTKSAASWGIFYGF